MDWYEVGDLLHKAQLEDVGKRLGIELERRGARLLALCPFHQDSRPSLTFFPSDASSVAHFHCFACGAHGHAIDLVKQVLGMDFQAAVQWLARQYGVKPQRKRISGRTDSTLANESALGFALRIFDSRHDEGRFRVWCEARGFDPGFLLSRGLRCITHSVLVEALQAQPLGERTELIDGLLSLGLIKRLQDRSKVEQAKLELADQFQDYFHDGRVVIPIRSGDSKRTEVVAFSGRALEGDLPDKVPKYLLTPGFEKAAHLFNAPDAFEGIKETLKSGKPAKLYLVEGFLDALRLQSLGQPAVALMGTSLGKGQFEQLKKFADETPRSTTLAYAVFLDNDPAGFRGADRLVRALLGLIGVELRWVGMPWRTQPVLGKDPDTCLRGLSGPEEAAAWLAPYDMPGESVLLASALASQDASELQMPLWSKLAWTVREKALFRAALVVKNLLGRRSPENIAEHLRDSPWPWAKELSAVLTGPGEGQPQIGRSVYLEEQSQRLALARLLAYHGARRGELPCDEDAWQTLNANERLFDRTAHDRLGAVMSGGTRWRQMAPFDAVHLPRKLTSQATVLDDPRLKVMPHPADLHIQQIVLNELLTQRHDRLSASGKVFSSYIPAVRWYASRKEVVVTGLDPDREPSGSDDQVPATLSFGYQIDMDVLEGDKTPTDQGMFRPFGECWRAFMASLRQQCHAIGPRVHVLRLDAKRYYDSIQRYVVRDTLLTPLKKALETHGVPEAFESTLGLDSNGLHEHADALERMLIGLIFHHEYRDPEVERRRQWSDEVTGIAQGPVLSAYLGTIALFPVDLAAREFIRSATLSEADGQEARPRAGYARYVDDVVLFADSEALLGQLREVLQAKASELSIDLIRKGERVLAGSPKEVMRQLNEGRGLAMSVPAWESPVTGDGDADWSLGGDLSELDRQTALQLLRQPMLMRDPSLIERQVKAAMNAPDLRPGDLGLCARWLWWQVAATMPLPDAVAAWGGFWRLWDEVTENLEWAEAFKQRGHHFLYAVEGLDKLLDANPWQANGQILAEREKSRVKRSHLAALVCGPEFFKDVKPAENGEHVLRRARSVARKAHRLARGTTAPAPLDTHPDEALTTIEWLCLAAQSLEAAEGERPLAALRNRVVLRCPGDDVAYAVLEKLIDSAPDVATRTVEGHA